MSHKEKIISLFRKGYSPLGTGPNDDLNSIYNNTFKKLVERKDLDLFFDLFETDETILKAWSFLGINEILKERTIDEEKKKIRLNKIITALLNDNSIIEYFGGKVEIKSTLREHHIRRICELHTDLIFDPVMAYIISAGSKTDDVIGELLENVISKVNDSRIEPIILDHAKNIDPIKFNLKINIVNAFENLGQYNDLKENDSILNVFKQYLNHNDQYINKISESNQKIDPEIHAKLKKIKENIFKVAAELNFDLERETLDFITALDYPYENLNRIAMKYKDNQKFKSLILKKLEESNNPYFIKDLLAAIIAMKDNIDNWKDLIVENLNKYELVDPDLIEEMQSADVFDEVMLLNFLNEGNKWQLDFIREFLMGNPEKLNIWPKFRNEFINILKFNKPPEDNWNKYPMMKEKKELTLKLLIDLKKEEMLKYCLDNIKNLDDDQLKKIALFAIIHCGNEVLMLELKEILKNNKELADFFKKFWIRLERNEFKFYY